MQIVIDIPEEKELIDKALWNDVSDFDKEDLVIVLNAIAHGTPLPKGHGRLIDADELYNSLEFPTQQFASAFKQVLNDAPTIIEADTESEEISDRNIKMWEEIFKAEKEDK